MERAGQLMSGYTRVAFTGTLLSKALGSQRPNEPTKRKSPESTAWERILLLGNNL
jgi:hypothetical protein